MAILKVPGTKTTITDAAQIKKFVNARGVVYEEWHLGITLPDDLTQEGILEAYDGFLKPFMAKGGYKTADVINVNAKTANVAELRQKFLKEHTHTEDEIRFFIEGEGLFWFHIGDEVFSLLCQAGDLISVPAHVKHWFDLGPSPYVKVIRIFTDPAGWVAQYTGSGVDQRFNPTY